MNVQSENNSPYAPPRAALRDVDAAQARARRRMLGWGMSAVVLLGMAAGITYWSIGAFRQVFESFGAELPILTIGVLKLRAAWFALPLAALLLTVASARRPEVFAPARVTVWLIGLLIGSIFLFSFGWFVLYLPIFHLGAAV